MEHPVQCAPSTSELTSVAAGPTYGSWPACDAAAARQSLVEPRLSPGVSKLQHNLRQLQPGALQAPVTDEVFRGALA